MDPDCITWQRAGDARVILMAGYALLLQVAHPTVGAGVTEHSDFRTDPWGRLLRTLDYAATMVYASPPRAAQTARALRAQHGTIRGVRPDGVRYSALEPEAFAWVHATLADAIVRGHARFGIPFDAAQRERFWGEWRAIGPLLGIGDDDLPRTWPAFEAYMSTMIRERLEHTQAVDDVLATLASPTPPRPLARAPRARHTAMRPPAHVALLFTIGMLPPPLRAKLHLAWTARQERELTVLCRALRAATPLMPRPLRITGPTYLRLRARTKGV
jgi:uncharacterized protein (DUF2236 family)